MSRLTRDGTAEPVSRDQILRRERGQGNINFPCSADYEQHWQPYPVDPYSCYMCDHNIYTGHNSADHLNYSVFLPNGDESLIARCVDSSSRFTHCSGSEARACRNLPQPHSFGPVREVARGVCFVKIIHLEC